MLTATERDQLNQGMKRLWIIWAIMIGSLGIYPIICHIVGDSLKSDMAPGFNLELLRNILMAMAATQLVFAYFLRKHLLQARPAPFLAGIIARQGTFLAGIIARQGIEEPAISRYTAAIVITLALSDAVGVFGLLSFFLSKSFQTLYLFLIPAGLAMIFFRPDMEELKELHATLKKEESGKQPDSGASGEDSNI